MNLHYRKYLLAPIFRLSPKRGLSLLLLLAMSFPLCAQVPDSATLFSKLKTGNESVKLKTLQTIYEEYYLSSITKGRPYALKAIDLARKLKDKKAEVHALNAISNYYSVKGDNDSALYFGQCGMEISKAINAKDCIARCYGRLGEVYRAIGNKARAIDYLKMAIEMDSMNKGCIAGYSMSLGIIYGDIGYPERSVFYYLKALKIREEQHRWIDAGYLYCNLSGFYFQPPYTDQGFKSIEKAIALFREAKFPKGESYADNILGMTYYDRMDYPAALKYYRESLAINAMDTLMLRSGYSFNLTNIGDTWLKMKNFDSALYYYSFSLRFSASTRDYLPMACTYLSFGDLNKQLKNYPKAIEFINKGLYYSRLVNYRSQWEAAYGLLSECYEAEGDHVNALAWLRKRNEVRDSILTEKAHQDVANMMIKYETQKKDEQISLLNSDSRAKQKKIRLSVVIILVILFFSGLLAYLAWLYYRKKLMPRVRTLDFIEEKISTAKEGDNRKMKALNKILPPRHKLITDLPDTELQYDHDLNGQLEDLLVRDKIFLNEDLTLAETARMLDTNTSYLSRFINDHHQVNFSAFLNRYRIEEAKKMILDDKYNNFSMEGIAKSSGFRSKSTFNQAFKNSTGLTPTQFAVRNGKVRE
jgi:tetratricopeptide (TPR) repeat protein